MIGEIRLVLHHCVCTVVKTLPNTNQRFALRLKCSSQPARERERMPDSRVGMRRFQWREAPALLRLRLTSVI